jgi:hypothetical protein
MKAQRVINIGTSPDMFAVTKDVPLEQSPMWVTVYGPYRADDNSGIDDFNVAMVRDRGKAGARYGIPCVSQADVEDSVLICVPSGTMNT